MQGNEFSLAFTDTVPGINQIAFPLRLNKLYHTPQILPFSRDTTDRGSKAFPILFREKVTVLQEDRIRACSLTYITICFHGRSFKINMVFGKKRIVACAPAEARLANPPRPFPYLRIVKDILESLSVAPHVVSVSILHVQGVRKSTVIVIHRLICLYVDRSRNPFAW